MVIDNNKNNLISDDDEEPTVELEPLSEEACAAMMLADDLAAESERVSGVDGIEGHPVAANMPISSEDTASEIEELRNELNFRVELNSILQHGIEQQREQCRRLTEQVAAVEKANQQASDELRRSRKQLAKTEKKLVRAKSREKALLIKLKKRKPADAVNLNIADQNGAIEELRKENQELTDIVADLRTRMIKAGEENEKLVAEMKEKDVRIDDYGQLPTLRNKSSAAEHTVPGRAPDAHRMSGSQLEDCWVLVGLDDVFCDTYVVGDGVGTIGSSPDSDIQIESKFVSRHHAQLIQNDRGCVVGDLNSTNGTFVNSRRINKRVLRAGDIVTIGKHNFRYEKQPAESIEIHEGTRHGTNHHVGKGRHWNPRN
jgi:hypothetical protein